MRIKNFANRNEFFPLATTQLSAAQILGASDKVSILPRRISEDFMRYRPLVIRPLSHSLLVIETAMIWSRRLTNEPAHRWLREIVAQVVRGFRCE